MFLRGNGYSLARVFLRSPLSRSLLPAPALSFGENRFSSLTLPSFYTNARVLSRSALLFSSILLTLSFFFDRNGEKILHSKAANFGVKKGKNARNRVRARSTFPQIHARTPGSSSKPAPAVCVFAEVPLRKRPEPGQPTPTPSDSPRRPSPVPPIPSTSKN